MRVRKVPYAYPRDSDGGRLGPSPEPEVAVCLVSMPDVRFSSFVLLTKGIPERSGLIPVSEVSRSLSVRNDWFRRVLGLPFLLT